MTAERGVANVSNANSSNAVNVGCGQPLYWWHQRLLAELVRLGPANSRELASNLGERHGDVLNWLDELIASGLVLTAQATSVVAGARWVMPAPIKPKIVEVTDAVA